MFWFMIVMNTLLTLCVVGVIGFTTIEYFKDRAWMMIFGINLPLTCVLLVFGVQMWLITFGVSL